MKKIFYTMAVAAALFAGYSAYNTTENRNLNGITLANIEALTASPEDSEPFNPLCYNGGVGSLSCSIGTGIEISTFGISLECSVSCDSGYYACCGIRCTCKRKS